MQVEEELEKKGESKVKKKGHIVGSISGDDIRPYLPIKFAGLYEHRGLVQPKSSGSTYDSALNHK